MADRSLPRLCIFTRAPVPGRVKRRLASQIGVQAAFEVHLALVERVLDALSDIPLPVELWVDGDVGHRLVRHWAQRYALPVRAQPPGDLGWKMHKAIEHCCAKSGSGIVVGSDLPAMDATYVAQAVGLLAEHDAVLGPAEDGGYALIGLNRPNAAVFADIDWGTSRVGMQTRAKLDRLGLNVGELPATWDVDTLSDWHRFVGTQSATGLLVNPRSARPCGG